MSKEAIAESFKNHPDREFVWLNKKGEWQFSEGGDFTIKKPRSEYTEDSVEPKEKPLSKKEKTKLKK